MIKDIIYESRWIPIEFIIECNNKRNEQAQCKGWSISYMKSGKENDNRDIYSTKKMWI